MAGRNKGKLKKWAIKKGAEVKKERQLFKSQYRERIEAINNRPNNGWKWTSMEHDDPQRISLMHRQLVARKYIIWKYRITPRELEYLCVFGAYRWYLPQDVFRLIGTTDRKAVMMNNKFKERGLVEVYKPFVKLYKQLHTFCLSHEGQLIVDEYNNIIAGVQSLPLYSDFIKEFGQKAKGVGGYVDLKVINETQNRHKPKWPENKKN